jgi:hypothetical protein
MAISNNPGGLTSILPASEAVVAGGGTIDAAGASYINSYSNANVRDIINSLTQTTGKSLGDFDAAPCCGTTDAP